MRNESRRRSERSDSIYLLLLPLLAFLATLPLFLHGCSCGHDFSFHLQSWLDAASQLRHGTFDPAWTYTAAWNAGEPRFIFYPPLSWMLGAALTLTLPLSATPLVFTWLALLASGLTMYRLARAYAAPPIALLASAVYIVNPYMLFTAFERTAYAELLAAAWLPLLLFAALRRKPSIPGLSLALALLWLTNAPAAVIGVYALIAIFLIRFALLFRTNTQTTQPSHPSHPTKSARAHESLALLARFAAGGSLGLALPAFYLLPAAYERRYVQVAMAIIPSMRFQDNFLFGHIGDGPHDGVLHTASLVAVDLLVATFAVLLCAWFLNRRRPNNPKPPDAGTETIPTTLPVIAILTAIIAFLLTPLSAFLWQHLPELVFLQFPWRLLCLLGAILALGVALLFRHVKTSLHALTLATCAVALLLAFGMGAWGISQFRQFCEASSLPSAHAQLFHTHHGVQPTDEYTPTNADNDTLRWDDPAYWLSPNPSAFAPGTVPNPAASIVNYDAPPPPDQTVSGLAPHHLELHLAQPETLILNLRDYPSWQITRNGALLPNHLQRDDGLLAVALPAGESILDIRWHRTWDETLGDIISLAALLLFAAALLRSRTIKT